MILEKALLILKQPVCDHCLGRQFAQLLHGFSNQQRGQWIRSVLAIQLDAAGGNEPGLDMSNFSKYQFRNLDIEEKEKKCSVCAGFFRDLDKWVEKIAKFDKEYSTFLVGNKISDDLIRREEELWERVGIDWCEPIKAEINREIGKIVEKELGKKCDLKDPDVSFILNLESNKLETEIRSLFIKGEYQKNKPGIPQTKWPSGKYKTSIEEIIAKPTMKKSGGTGHKLHGMGREDIDATCSGWRPFVLEILEPEKRIQPKKLKLTRGVRVRKLQKSNIKEVRKLKEKKPDKTYEAVVVTKGHISKNELKKLDKLKGTVAQKTPLRVKHRRANKTRKRRVKKVATKYKTRQRFILTVRAEAGTYIKELVSGDEGRSKPSVAQILDTECYVKELDVKKIHI